MMGSLILAVRFLTIVPVPGREAQGAFALGRAAWWFPVVGLALGGGLAGPAVSSTPCSRRSWERP